MISEHVTFIQGNKDILTRYEQTHFLGNGNNFVYEMLDRQTGAKQAVKIFDLKNEDIECFKNEVQLLEKIRSQPNKYIINYLGYCIAEKRAGGDTNGNYQSQIMGYILMEKGKANLNNYIKKRVETQQGIFPQQVFIRFLQQMVEVHCHLQNIQIAHRDVKPDNIIITGEEESVDFKVCDVGAGTQSLNSTKTRTLIGTVSFFSPELYQCFHSKKDLYVSYNPYVSDAFSLGLVFLYFATFQRIDSGSRQNMSMHQYHSKLKELAAQAVSNYPALHFLKDLLDMMLQPDPTHRADFLKVQAFLEQNHFYSQFIYTDTKAHQESCLTISQAEGPVALQKIYEMSQTDKQQILTLDIDLKNNQLNKSTVLDDFGKSFKYMLNMKDFLVNLEINDLQVNNVKRIFENITELVRLQKLELQLWNNNIKDAGFTHLLLGVFNHPTLKNLLVNVSVNNISDKSLLDCEQTLKTYKMDNLEHFALDFSLNMLSGHDSGRALQVLAALIANMPRLSSLDLNFEGNKIKTHGTRFLVSSLPLLPQLTALTLNFAFNEVTDNGLYALCDYIKAQGSSLEKLKLVLPGNMLSDKFFKQLSLSLPALTNILHLNLQLHNNPFSGKHFDLFTKALPCMVRMTHLTLNFSHIELTDLNIKQFSLSLQDMTHLTTLKLILDRVPINNPSSKYISTAVSKLTGLTHLQLSFNSIKKIDTLSLVFVALAFSNLPKLDTLSISMQGVPLEIDCFKQICDSFMKTHKLRVFHFQFQECQIDGPSAQAIFSRLRYLTILESFDICLKDNPIPENDRETIIQQLKHTYKDTERFSVKF